MKVKVQRFIWHSKARVYQLDDKIEHLMGESYYVDKLPVDERTFEQEYYNEPLKTFRKHKYENYEE